MQVAQRAMAEQLEKQVLVAVFQEVKELQVVQVALSTQAMQYCRQG